jgi:hypothetical protein
MSQELPRTSGDPADVGESAPGPGEPDRSRGLRQVVLGAVLTVLAPLAGFLFGSIVGPDKQMGDFDVLFVSMFLGLAVGGIGAVVTVLGCLRWFRGSRDDLRASAGSPERPPVD